MTADLVVHLARFGRALREQGVRLAPSDLGDGLEALTRIDLGDRQEVRCALRVAFKIEPRDSALFERLFAVWWGGAAGPTSLPPVGANAANRPGGGREPAPLAMPLPADAELSAVGQIRYSAEAAFRKRAFEECSDADLRAMERLMARWARRLAVRPGRRLVPSRRRGTPDLRRSFRRAIAYGGEFGSLAQRVRAPERPRLLVLCDTSGSMDPHARFLLSFVLALRRAARGCEIFAFNTSLVRLTPWLRPGKVAETLRRLQTEVPGWSSGTRIGECLADFCAQHLSRLDRDTTVLIFSDGLDQGDLAPLEGAMRALRERARTVVWLNPLAGDERYEPTARAMACALPFVDHLLPAHNLDALVRVLPLLVA